MRNTKKTKGMHRQRNRLSLSVRQSKKEKKPGEMEKWGGQCSWYHQHLFHESISVNGSPIHKKFGKTEGERGGAGAGEWPNTQRIFYPTQLTVNRAWTPHDPEATAQVSIASKVKWYNTSCLLGTRDMYKESWMKGCKNQCFVKCTEFLFTSCWWSSLYNICCCCCFSLSWSCVELLCCPNAPHAGLYICGCSYSQGIDITCSES